MPILNTEADRKSVRHMMGEIVNSMTRDEAEKELRKELFKRLKDEFDIQPKVARKIVKVMYKGNIDEVQEEHEEFETLYQMLKSISTFSAASTASAEALTSELNEA